MNDNNNLTEQEANELFFSIYPKLLNYAKSFSLEHCEDLVNTTYIKVVSNRDKFQRGSNFNGWCFTILRNEWLETIRKRKREVQDTDNMYSMYIAVDGYQEENTEIEQLQRILKQLPKRDREILINIGILGLSYEEASKVLNMSLGTIKSSFSRLKEHIKETLHPTVSSIKAPISDNAVKIQCLHNSGKTISEIAEITGLKRSEIMKGLE